MKKLAPIFLVLVIIGLGAGAFFATKKSTPQVSNNQAAPTTVQQPTETKAESAQGSLKSLLTMGKTAKCTFSNKTESANVDGTVYVANGKMRGDFKTTYGKNTSSGHIIVDSKDPEKAESLMKEAKKLLG